MSDSLPRIGYTDADLAGRVREALDGPAGGCIVRGMPCGDAEQDGALEGLSLALGEPLNEPHNLRGGMVCRVEVEPVAQNAQRPYANTPFHFPGHTDCTDYAEPPDTVLLLCERPAASGGDSFVATLGEILARLAPADILALQQPQFYFRYGYLPVLSRRQRRNAIRYNRILLEMFAPADQPEHIAALYDRLDAAIAAASFSFALASGDCLILDNQTCVHGRSAFGDDAGRLMKRVRLNRHRQT